MTHHCVRPEGQYALGELRSLSSLVTPSAALAVKYELRSHLFLLLPLITHAVHGDSPSQGLARRASGEATHRRSAWRRQPEGLGSAPLTGEYLEKTCVIFRRNVASSAWRACSPRLSEAYGAVASGGVGQSTRACEARLVLSTPPLYGLCCDGQRSDAIAGGVRRRLHTKDEMRAAPTSRSWAWAHAHEYMDEYSPW